MSIIVSAPWVVELDNEEIYLETEEMMLDFLYDCEEEVHGVKKLAVVAVEEYDVTEEEDEFGEIEYKLGKRKE